MEMKVSIRLGWPIRFERIRNGEKIIVQTGPDEFDVDVSDGKLDGESPIVELNRLLDEEKRKLRRHRVRKHLQG